MSPRQISMGPRPSVPMLPLTAAENKPIPNDADIGSSWDVVTDAPNQTGATDFIGMDVDPQGSHGPLSLQNNDMTAMWSQINSIIGEAPNTILPNSMPTAIQVVAQNRLQTVHNYNLTVNTGNAMEQRMAAMAAQYHSELITSRHEEQRQHQLAMEQGIYAQRYAQATVAIGERAVSELQDFL